MRGLLIQTVRSGAVVRLGMASFLSEKAFADRPVSASAEDHKKELWDQAPIAS